MRILKPKTDNISKIRQICLKSKLKFKQALDVAQLRDPIAISVLAKNVKRFRVLSNLTQEELANMADIEYSQISRIERGVINTSVSVIFAIAKALQVKPSDLLEM